MIYNRFPAGTIVEIRGSRYQPSYTHGLLQLTHVVTGELFRCEQPDGSFGLPSIEQFEALLAIGDIVIKSPRANDAIRNFNDEAEWTRDQAIALTEDAEFKSKVCQILDDNGVKQGLKAIATGLKLYWTSELITKYGEAPNPSTVRNWRATRGRVGDRHPRHMVSLTGRNFLKRARTDPASRLLAYCVIEGRENGLKVPDIHGNYISRYRSMIEQEGLEIEIPELKTKDDGLRKVRRLYNLLESDETLASNVAKEAKEQDWSGAGKTMTADHVMQYVIIDHTQLDEHIVCPKLELLLGRPWITLAVDVKSRAAVGHLITFTDPCSWSLSEILRRIALPKRPPSDLADKFPILAQLRGKPTTLILDNGTEFLAQSHEAAARDAGFSVMFCPIKKPRYRAICERAIQTVNFQSSRLLPGRTMSLHDARRLGFDAEKHAVVMADELEAVMNQIIAIYNIQPHAGLNGKQPALVFEQCAKRTGISNFADFDSFARDTMEVRAGRQLTPSGIRAFGLRYHDAIAVPDLLRDLVPIEPRRQRRDDATATVEFRFDSMDISRIHVWNRRTRKYVTLRCADENYADGMPHWLHERIKEMAKAQALAFDTEKHRIAARGRLVEFTRQIDPGEFAESRKRVAQMYEIPRLRQVTGNLFDLHNTLPSPVGLDIFIANDRARETSLDQEILAPRSAPRPKREKTALERRRAHMVQTQQAQPEAGQPQRGRNLLSEQGDYQ